MTEQQGKLLPFYLVVDVSFSMEGSKLAAANKVLPKVLDALAENPILGDKVRFALLDFSDDAQVRLPLCNLLDEHVTMPALEVRGGTSYAAAFRLLRHEIEANVKQLKADGFAVHRPAVFFLSDGEPTDTETEWKDAFRELTFHDREAKSGFPMYPNFVPCGVGGANPQVLQQLIHPTDKPKAMKMYLMDNGEDAAEAINKIAEILISSILMSGRSMQQGNSGILLPAGDDLPSGLSAHGPDDDFV